MKTLQKDPILDPLWLTKAKYLDLEYYNYVLLDAKQKYLAHLKTGSFDRFHEILFNYLNINTAVVDRGVYDAAYNFKNNESHIMEIISSLTRSKEEFGGEIIGMASRILGEILDLYLIAMLQKLAYCRLYFNAAEIHKLDKLYLATTQNHSKSNNIWKISKDITVPFIIKGEHALEINEFACEDGLFNELVKLTKPEISDFCAKKNVLVISSAKRIKSQTLYELGAATVIANRLLNYSGLFNSNILLDIQSLLERGQVIPYKLRVN
jgi:hypothetical protein